MKACIQTLHLHLLAIISSTIQADKHNFNILLHAGVTIILCIYSAARVIIKTTRLMMVPQQGVRRSSNIAVGECND